MNIKTIVPVLCSMLFFSCGDEKKTTVNDKPVHLITLDPGHFHAALVQKSMYDDVDSVVYVYAPAGNDVLQHLERIKNYNARIENPTHWKEELYTGPDFFERMLKEKKNNLVMLAGNNEKKTAYIYQSLEAGLNVFADKPMAIDSANFILLLQAFATAKQNNLLLYDIMTERFEITNILQRALAMLPDVFGTLKQGTESDPSIINESVHYLYKYVSGNVLVRPAWFFDVKQEGEGIADVATHLVDLNQWVCFPNQLFDHQKDIKILSAKHWPTDISLSQFSSITHENTFPAYLSPYIKIDSELQYYCNGSFNYLIKGVSAKVTVRWDYQALNNSGDTYYSLIKGTKASLEIRQGTIENYKPTLYIQPVKNDTAYENALRKAIAKIQQQYPGIAIKKNIKEYEIIIPEKYKEGHEAHFAKVTGACLDYLKNKNMPAWEVSAMITKYYTTTTALEMAKKNDIKK